jgi:hypothetical protein
MPNSEKIRCDTDFFELISISDQEKMDHIETQSILYDSLKNAALNKNFDFEVSSLRLFKKKDGNQFLLLHTRVYGGEKNINNHIKFLIEADEIASRSMKNELDKLSIKFNIVLKQYIFYAERLEKFKGALKEKFPEFRYIDLNQNSALFVGDRIIAVSSENREIAGKLGGIAFNIVEVLVKQPIINNDSISNAIDFVIDKCQEIDSIERTVITRLRKKTIFSAMAINLMIILTFLVFTYTYFWEFLNDRTLGFITILVLTSITGMSLMIFLHMLHNKEVIYK